MNLTILNDLHIGVERVSGTTAASRWALKEHLRNTFKSLLPESNDLMVLGDLFDTHNVPLVEVLGTYEILSTWLAKGYKLFLVAGNHDLSKSSNVLSSFDMLGALLKSIRPAQVFVITEPTMTPHGYVVPHLPDQTAFDGAISKVPDCDYLFLHCNYSNFFAAQSDQSLNLSKEQADALLARTVVIAHEHQHREVGKVKLPGNQIAASVSDWQHCESKYCYEIVDGVLTTKQLQQKASEYVEQGWKDLQPTTAKFVRVTGEATAEQAAQVVSAIAKYRAGSDALVVANAVQIAANEGLGAFATSLEAAQAFNVWQALEAVLEESEVQTLKGLV